jgi:SAM-dependent methyltransferase
MGQLGAAIHRIRRTLTDPHVLRRVRRRAFDRQQGPGGLALDDLAAYQRRPVAKFVDTVPSSVNVILEIGSDQRCSVLHYLSENLNCFSIGVDPSPAFGRHVDHEKVIPIQALGESLPIKDASVDAVISIATLEHVEPIPELLSEVRRVLRPGGMFYSDFGPIWSCAVGHHVFAQIDGKEARFWKEGRNPIPDYYHLLLSKEEMAAFLTEGPCDQRLVEPIVEWIYSRPLINRFFFEDYQRFFAASDMEVEYCRGRERLGQKPSPETEPKLRQKYGRIDFTSAFVEALCRKSGEWAPEGLVGQTRVDVLTRILRCPVSGGDVHYSEELEGYVSERAGIVFPTVDGVPVLKAESALQLGS